MKRLLSLLALVGALAAPGRLAAQSIPIGLGGQLSSAVHVPIVVPIVADMSARPEKLGSYALRLQWNQAVLQITFADGGTFGTTLTVNSDSLALGVLHIAGVNPAGASGRIVLADLQVLLLVKASDTLRLDVTGLYAAGTYADLTSSQATSGAIFCPARGLWGDIDGDGNANSRDALIALSNAVGLDVSAFDVGLGDVDGNGVTNARDALIILSNAVGVDVSAFRVLRIAGGSCSSNAAVALSITPTATDTLIKGQSVQFQAWAADSVSGALQAVADPTWKSSAPLVLSIGPDGRASARDTGTVTITALRGTRDSAQTTVHILARRTTDWVDAAALTATNRLGSAAFPFGSVEEGLQFAQDGDTLRVRLGSYAIAGGTLALSRPVVLIGDTAADGSRPTLVPDTGLGGWSGDAIDIMGPGRYEVQNLAFSGASTGVYVGGADCVLLRGLRMTTTGDGVYLDMPMHCLRIEHSVILDGGTGVTTYATVDTLTIEDTEIGGFDYGVNLVTIPDTTTIRRSSLHDFQYGAVVTNGCYDCTAPYRPSGARPASRARPAHAPVARSPMDGSGQPPAIVVEWSRLARANYGYLVDLGTPFRRMAFAHNVMTNPGQSAVYVSGYSYTTTTSSSGYLSMVGDSIVAPPENQHYFWLDAEYLDSVTIDSVHVVGAGEGYTSDAALVRMTNSTLRDVRTYGLEVSTGPGGGVLQLDNDSVIGDPRDDAQVYAFEQYGARVEANRVTVINAYKGIDAEGSDSSVTVTNSVFRHVQYPVYWEMNNYPGPSASTLTVKHSTFDGFSWGVDAYRGRMVVDSNTFVNGQQPIYLDSPRPVAVRGNQITASEYGIEAYAYDSSNTVTIADNVLTGIGSAGIYATGTTYPDSLRSVLDVRGNNVACSPSGAGSARGIALEDGDFFVVGNTVTGCYAGIRTINNNNATRLDSIVGNTVTVPADAQVGIGVTGLVLALIRHNTVTGAATGQQTYGLIDVASCPDAYACPDENIPLAVIDSNTVTGGTVWGIHADGVDTLDVAMNTVTNLNSPSGAYSEDYGGISMGSVSSFARILGNVVKHIAGNGIVTSSSSGVTVAVDSNVVADVRPLTGDTTVGGTGIYPYQGPATITRNLVTGARRDGIRVGSDNYASLVVTGNNVAGNLPYGLRVLADRTVPALDNWWGDHYGPRGTSGSDSSSVGDSVTSNVTFDPYLSVQNASAPTVVPLAPRFLALAPPRPAAMLTSASRYAPFPPADRFPVERAARPAPAGAPRAASAGAPTARDARRAAREQARTERAAQRAQRLQELRARIEARDRARQAAHTSPPGGTRSQGVRP